MNWKDIDRALEAALAVRESDNRTITAIPRSTRELSVRERVAHLERAAQLLSVRLASLTLTVSHLQLAGMPAGQ